MFDRLTQLAQRISAYPPWQVALELLVIALVVYAVVRFVQGTRAAGALKGLMLVVLVATLLVRIIGQREAFERLTFLYQYFLTLAAFTFIVIFQPELRRGLIKLGEGQLFRRGQATLAGIVDEVVRACAYLSKARFGAIIVIERENALGGLVEGGTALGARVSAPLIQTIFFPGSALHDLALVIEGATVKAAGVQLPLAEPEDMPDPSLGSRHRAAVGLSKESDALVIVVSEESGAISLAENGRLRRALSPEDLRQTLLARLPRAAWGEHAPDDAALPQPPDAAPDQDNQIDAKRTRPAGVPE